MFCLILFLLVASVTSFPEFGDRLNRETVSEASTTTVSIIATVEEPHASSILATTQQPSTPLPGTSSTSKTDEPTSTRRTPLVRSRGPSSLSKKLGEFRERSTEDHDLSVFVADPPLNGTNGLTEKSTSSTSAPSRTNSRPRPVPSRLGGYSGQTRIYNRKRRLRKPSGDDPSSRGPDIQESRTRDDGGGRTPQRGSESTPASSQNRLSSISHRPSKSDATKTFVAESQPHNPTTTGIKEIGEVGGAEGGRERAKSSFSGRLPSAHTSNDGDVTSQRTRHVATRRPAVFVSYVTEFPAREHDTHHPRNPLNTKTVKKNFPEVVTTYRPALRILPPSKESSTISSTSVNSELPDNEPEGTRPKLKGDASNHIEMSGGSDILPHVGASASQENDIKTNPLPTPAALVNRPYQAPVYIPKALRREKETSAKQKPVYVEIGRDRHSLTKSKVRPSYQDEVFESAQDIIRQAHMSNKKSENKHWESTSGEHQRDERTKSISSPASLKRDSEGSSTISTKIHQEKSFVDTGSLRETRLIVEDSVRPNNDQKESTSQKPLLSFPITKRPQRHISPHDLSIDEDSDADCPYRYYALPSGREDDDHSVEMSFFGEFDEFLRDHGITDSHFGMNLHFEDSNTLPEAKGKGAKSFKRSPVVTTTWEAVDEAGHPGNSPSRPPSKEPPTRIHHHHHHYPPGHRPSNTQPSLNPTQKSPHSHPQTNQRLHMPRKPDPNSFPTPTLQVYIDPPRHRFKPSQSQLPPPPKSSTGHQKTQATVQDTDPKPFLKPQGDLIRDTRTTLSGSSHNHNLPDKDEHNFKSQDDDHHHPQFNHFQNEVQTGSHITNGVFPSPSVPPAPKPQEPHLHHSPKPQEPHPHLPSKLQEPLLHLPPKPQEPHLHLPPKPQEPHQHLPQHEPHLRLPPKPQEPHHPQVIPSLMPIDLTVRRPPSNPQRPIRIRLRPGKKQPLRRPQRLRPLGMRHSPAGLHGNGNKRPANFLNTKSRFRNHKLATSLQPPPFLSSAAVSSPNFIRPPSSLTPHFQHHQPTRPSSVMKPPSLIPEPDHFGTGREINHEGEFSSHFALINSNSNHRSSLKLPFSPTSRQHPRPPSFLNSLKENVGEARQTYDHHGSQPLPQGLHSSVRKMSESHQKLMKNLEYGVNGEPLDVWIPISSINDGQKSR